MTKPDGRDGDEAFLKRWSRRKTEETETEEQPPAPALEEENPIVEVDAEAEVADIVADLPDIETLDKDSDYTGFLQEGVPDALKNMALRKLWLSDPIFANLDGLNDYDEDFGAILRAGADYMQKLKDAGETFTRPGSEKPEIQEAEQEETDAEQTENSETAPRDPDIREPGSEELAIDAPEEEDTPLNSNQADQTSLADDSSNNDPVSGEPTA
jgi:hypothetical protein